MKNKISKRKFEMTAVFLTLLFIAMMKLVTMTASPVSAEDLSSFPSLFYNDKDYIYSVPGNVIYTPLEQVDGEFYVPVYLFNCLNDIEMKTNDGYTNQFYIKYKNNYIIFNVSAEKAEINSKESISCKVYFMRGATYVPAVVVAKALNLQWEYNEQYNAFRIKQAGAKKPFEDILAPHIRKIQTTAPPTTETTRPVSPPPVQTTTAPVIETTTAPVAVITTEPIEEITPAGTTSPPPPTVPTTTEEPTTAENTEEIENYLMFYSGGSYGTDEDDITDKTETDKINEVLKTLDKSDMKAVFFLSGNEIRENPEILRKIYSAGHELGIKIDGGITELESANDLIYSAVKHKTRFFMFNNIGGTELNGADEIIKRGYYLCENTVDILDLANINNQNEMIDFMKRESLNVFMFDLNDENYKNYIGLSAKAAEIKFYIKFSYINNANIEKIKNKIEGRK